MSTDAISPLRHRMIEDMSARQLHPVTQKGHIRACKRFAAFLKRSPDTSPSGVDRLPESLPSDEFGVLVGVERGGRVHEADYGHNGGQAAAQALA